MGKTFTQTEAELKSIQVGIKMVGKYIGSTKNTNFECPFCQTIFIATPGHIWQKATRSCGCQTISYNRADLIGEKFGRLEVIKLDHIEHKDKKHYNAVWECWCVCGNITYISTNTLLSKRGTKSCGCFHKEKASEFCWRGTKDISGRYFSQIKTSAKRRNLEFNITIQQLQILLEKQDYKCALSFLPICCTRNRQTEQTASLDRIDSTKGYVIDNIQWVHKDVNFMKQEYSQERFIEICKLIAGNN